MKTNNNIEKNQLGTLTGAAIEVPVGDAIITIKEPTLAVLDAMSKHWLDLPDLSDIKTVEDVKARLSDIRPHIKTLARVVAMAILGERQFTLLGAWRLRHKTEWIYHNLRPSQLKDLTEIITAMNGLVPFTVSMRLMSAARTTAAKTSIES